MRLKINQRGRFVRANRRKRSTGRLRPAAVAYWLAIIVPLLLHVSVTLAIWGHDGSSPVRTPFELAIMFAQLVWLLPLPWALLNLGGLLRYGPPRDLEPAPGWRWNRRHALLVIAYVSRGENESALRDAVIASQQVLDRLGVSYVIEIVTDILVPPSAVVPSTTCPVVYHRVPEAYQTAHHVRFKARALQYLLERRIEADCYGLARPSDSGIWVLHLDEESVLTPGLVVGIQEFIARSDRQPFVPTVGQGEILYNSHMDATSSLLAASDMVRTGDDLGRFRLQWRAFHTPLFGMHGSFVLLPHSVEKEITWDLGERGSLTEDARFALEAAQRGIRFDWVEGFLKEQSPVSISDLVRQRARWLNGLSDVAGDPGLSWRTTCALRLFVVFWKLSWLGGTVLVLTVVAGLMGHNTVPSSFCLAAYAAIAGAIGSTYVVGAVRNAGNAQFSRWKSLRLVFSTYLWWLSLAPSLLEGMAVIVALWRPARQFHVVLKGPRAITSTPQAIVEDENARACARAVSERPAEVI